MAAPNPSKTLLVGILVLLLATAFVPNASASVVRWDLTMEELQDDVRIMDAANLNSTPREEVSLDEPVLWVSNAVATQPLSITGQWGFSLRFTGVSSGLLTSAEVTLELGTWTESGFVVQHSRDITVADSVLGQVTTSVGSGTPISVTINVAEGERIGVRLEFTSGEGTLVVGTSEDSTATPSHIRTPDADPNFPVPELGSILLLLAGLGVVGSVVYVKNRKQA